MNAPLKVSWTAQTEVMIDHPVDAEEELMKMCEKELDRQAIRLCHKAFWEKMDNISITFKEDSDYNIHKKLYDWLGITKRERMEKEFNSIVEEFQRKKALANILKEIRNESK